MPSLRCSYTLCLLEGAKILKELKEKQMNKQETKFNYQQQYGVIVIC